MSKTAKAVYRPIGLIGSLVASSIAKHAAFEIAHVCLDCEDWCRASGRAYDAGYRY